MPLVFISYERSEVSRVELLAADLRTLGLQPWFDRQIAGGAEWWDDILENIRRCDLFAYVATPAALDSLACQRELQYASALGKFILPIALLSDASSPDLPRALEGRQLLPYYGPDREKVAALARGVGAAPPSKPLPDSLPEQPPMPLSKIGEVRDALGSSSLALDEQIAILTRLRQAAAHGATRPDAIKLLARLRGRGDISFVVAREIDAWSILAPGGPSSHTPQSPAAANAASKALDTTTRAKATLGALGALTPLLVVVLVSQSAVVGEYIMAIFGSPAGHQSGLAAIVGYLTKVTLLVAIGAGWAAAFDVAGAKWWIYYQLGIVVPAMVLGVMNATSLAIPAFTALPSRQSTVVPDTRRDLLFSLIPISSAHAACPQGSVADAQGRCRPSRGGWIDDFMAGFLSKPLRSTYSCKGVAASVVVERSRSVTVTEDSNKRSCTFSVDGGGRTEDTHRCSNTSIEASLSVPSSRSVSVVSTKDSCTFHVE